MSFPAPPAQPFWNDTQRVELQQGLLAIGFIHDGIYGMLSDLDYLPLLIGP